jgi:hypothetical protein
MKNGKLFSYRKSRSGTALDVNSRAAWLIVAILIAALAAFRADSPKVLDFLRQIASR